MSDVCLPSQIYRQMYGKLEKLTGHLLAKLHPSNLVNTIFYLVRCNSQIEKFNFGRSYGATTQYRATFEGLYIYGSFGSAVDEGMGNDLYMR